MKKIILSAIGIALLATSCTKKPQSDSKPLNTPLHAALPTQYISVEYIGVDESNPQLTVDYAGYKHGLDCDKKVFDAATATVSGNTGVSKVTIKGAYLTMTFERGKNVQPSKVALTYNTDLYKAVYQKWQWSGYLLISGQNSSMTPDQFEKALSVTVRAINTGDVATITNKTTLSNSMLVEYTISSTSGSDPSVHYEVQTSLPITLTSQVKVNCLIPGFVEPQKSITVDWKTGLVPTEKDLGGGLKSYSQDIYTSFVDHSLEQYIAVQYFTTKVYPVVK